jgi:hypothetical protein
MANAHYHALAAASNILRRNSPKGARAWSRALPLLKVSVPGKLRRQHSVGRHVTVDCHFQIHFFFNFDSTCMVGIC